MSLGEKKQSIQILELDELFTYIKKSCKAYVFLAIQGETLQVIDLYATLSRDQKAYQILKNRLIKRYTVNYLCSDNYDIYKQQIIAY